MPSKGNHVLSVVQYMNLNPSLLAQEAVLISWVSIKGMQSKDRGQASCLLCSEDHFDVNRA